MTQRKPIRLRRLALLLPFCLYCATGLAGLAPSREDIVFLVDNSRTMQQADRQVSLPAAINTFLSRISSDVRTALILFDDTVTLEVPFTPINGEAAGDMAKGLERINYENRFSNTAAALERALYEQRHNGRRGAGRTILLFSSGTVDTGNEAQDLNFERWMTQVLGPDAADKHIRIFCFAFSNATQAASLEELARRTGGDFFRYTGGDDLSSLLERAADEIFSRPLSAPRQP